MTNHFSLLFGRALATLTVGALLASSADAQTNTLTVHLTNWTIDIDNVPPDAKVDEDDGTWPFWAWDVSAKAGEVKVAHACELWEDGGPAAGESAEVFLKYESQRTYNYHPTLEHPWGKAKEVLVKSIHGSADVTKGIVPGGASGSLWLLANLVVSTTIRDTEYGVDLSRTMTTGPAEWSARVAEVLQDRLGISQSEAELLAGIAGVVTYGSYHGTWNTSLAVPVVEQGNLEAYEIGTTSLFYWYAEADGGLAKAIVKSDGTLKIYGDIYLTPQ